ncbi:hypothetical protein ACHAPV_001911 [Trichoderma viride]
MRTRRSNNTKKYTLDKYDFLSSGDEREQTPKRRKTADDDDNFEAPAEERSAAEDEDEDEDEDEEDVQMNDDSASEVNARERPSRQRPKSTKPSKPADPGEMEVTGYLDIELIPPEGQHKGYVGPYERGMRGKALARTLYGPQPERIEMAHTLLERWGGWTLYPPKVPQDEDEPTDKGFWTPGGLEKEARLAKQWYEQVSKGLSSDDVWSELSPNESEMYRFPQLSMPVLTGPHEEQQEVLMEPGASYPLSQSNISFDQDEDEDKVECGWMLDVGGLVLGMDWAPRRDKNPKQLLALAVIPQSDQGFYNYEEESVKPGFQLQGIVQIWEFKSTKTDEGFTRTSKEPATLRKNLCLDYGRARRVRWSPSCNHIAVLSSDGNVYVADAGDLDGEEGEAYYKLQKPFAVLNLIDEYSIKATAIAWVNCNRMAVGYSDGSIALWSIYPQRLLSRHPVHHSDIIDMVSGYPTLPNIIASIPVGGTARLIDLQAPTVGRLHPFLLIGATDGSLWCLNAQTEVFSNRHESTDKIRVFQHEHRPGHLFPPDSPVAARGVCRVLHGFTVDRNRNSKPEAKLSAKKGKKLRAKEPAEVAAEEGEGEDDDDEAGDLTDPFRATLHEALTRITAIEWNPNLDHGTWAAVAMGSGLVRVIDLGLEKYPEA